MTRKNFHKVVAQYLGARNGRNDYWCPVLNRWLDEEFMRCAHIVPKSFDSKELNSVFGVSDSALESKRNGLCLHKVLENAFDNMWVAIVPSGKIE